MTADPSPVRFADAVIRLDSMPVTGRDIDVAPTEEERAALAAQLGVTSVDRLAVKLHAVKFRGGIRVTGRLTASVTQPSVLTLEPVAQEIAEPIDRVFLPAGEKDYAGPADAEVFVDLEGEDLPDHFEGNEADVSDLIAETLALVVDLYPRGPAETLQLPADAAESADDSPFAALKSLKDKP
jgi:uncharacterized metal-binding protein YceD (DUF177 family)